MSDDENKPPAEGEAPPAEGEEPPKDDKAGEGDDEKKPLLAMPAVGMPKMSFGDPPKPESAASAEDKWKLGPCCCCLCACSHDRVGDATCMGCFPIKCGVIFIAMFIFLLSVIMLACSFF